MSAYAGIAEEVVVRDNGSREEALLDMPLAGFLYWAARLNLSPHELAQRLFGG